jgi:hypothetical protein
VITEQNLEVMFSCFFPTLVSFWRIPLTALVEVIAERFTVKAVFALPKRCKKEIVILELTDDLQCKGTK